jgi:single-stranded-DNA-specific exonuclease
VLVREQAQDQLSKPVVLVAGPRDAYPEGIIGLVAGKLSEEIKRPVFVLSQDTESSRGSARSYGDFNIIEALRNRADLLERHGGHAQAAGFTIANANIEELRKHLLTWQTGSTSIHAGVGSLKEECCSQMVDMVIPRPEALGYAAYMDISQLSPFGAGNPEPVFKMDNLFLLRCWPSGPDGSTLQVRLQFGSVQFRGSYKGGGAEGAQWREGIHVNVIFHLLPALRSTDGEGDEQGVWLEVLHMEVRAGG